MSQQSTTATGGFWDWTRDFFQPGLEAWRDQWVRENFPEQQPGYDNTTAPAGSGIDPIDLEERRRESEQRLWLIGGAAVLTAILAASVLSR